MLAIKKDNLVLFSFQFQNLTLLLDHIKSNVAMRKENELYVHPIVMFTLVT